MSGPLQVIAVSFGLDADFEGRVLAEVDRLQGRRVLRLLDMFLVAKHADGGIHRLVVGDDDDFGSLLARIVPLEGAGLVGRTAGEASWGFDPSDAWVLAQSLLPGTGLAFFLVEHSWAQPLLDAIAETGGALLGEGFLTSEAGLLVEAEVAAIDEAARVIAAAQDAEARATLLAIAARARATEAVVASDVVRAAAAADAVRALITAGLVEEAAAHEAVEALSAAGLIVAAAEEEAAEAVAEGAATVKAASITVAQARVLRYLPTKLTFAVIADKLGISRAAAKERAERAYKKLGVHSRAEAVSRARELGLID
jgi:DNA-binding NarL/FixJ family response regulator